MGAKSPEIPGFRAITDQVLVREGTLDDSPSAASQPGTIIIYGWGDGLPRHVAKFAEGYRVLFPRSRQIVVLSPIKKAIFSTLEQRSEWMTPVMKEAFPGPSDESDDARPLAQRSILVHAMSNAGGINLASTLNIYLKKHGRPLPHQLLVMDSTPGGTDFTFGNVKRWARAVALGFARYLPWPFFVTQSLCAIFVCFNRLAEMLSRRESAGAWSRKAVKDPAYKSKDARNLYLYSQADDLIYWQDIVQHAAETKRDGWTSDVEEFKGSGHVDHMRKAPQKYWGAIASSWQSAIESAK